MDLMNFVPSEDNVVVNLTIKGQQLNNEDGTPMTITVLSPFSKKYKEIAAKESTIRIKEVKANPDKETDYEEFAIDLLAKTTVDWNITWDKKKPKFSEQLAKVIYQKAFWIKNLISEEQSKLVDFTIP